MNHYEIFKLCLIKYEELIKGGTEKKWFFKHYNQFALINLEENNFDLYKIHIVHHRTIYSFMITLDDEKREVVHTIIRLNNIAIKFSGILGMGAFVHADNLHRIPIQGHFQAAKSNDLYWKTLLSKY